ncbi:HlyD family efflux transporter periplasmic adaptor subunit [Mucilaginibacter sp. RB4R14]|uniref:HlyD family secretion protein n=1 Tax=Mucilaginibacter aurantiaciroseus TaxID=2949308 RepID=UPI002091BAF6|nr:HlyD family efflux transporter periplasmic adaptor subunit [Mucilaginibacter aurantiaciroseus]MCO5936512.1 HlyD family efflux transporter periplasmic adaptor subunit [Mucilaginibacter aurantiaciroseus]
MFLEKNTEIQRFSAFQSFQTVMQGGHHTHKIRWLSAGLVIICIALLAPWTQNIRSKGSVSTLDPQQRPQEVNTMIPGRIVKWYVQDGSMVQKGDTLLEITEIKDDYLDPQLTQRTAEQLNSKNAATLFYKDKAATTNRQLAALQQSLEFKLKQINNKVKQYALQVQSDSISMNAAANLFNISQGQLKRQKELYNSGLKSLTEYEQRQQYYQDAMAKRISAENKFYSSKNELLNIKLELSAASQDYTEKISKVSGERFVALSQIAIGEGEVSKLRNQLYNYQARQGFHYIIAPQSGQVLQNIKAGIGETVKDGEQLLTIVPIQFKKAIEIYIDPNDLPLIHPDQLVRIQFDGFPAIVFSGWPKASYGLFNGKIAAIDNRIDASGKFKVWVTPKEDYRKWPETVRFGTGCQVIALLNNVPVGYELWRQLNGFPPDFYKKVISAKDQSVKKK